MVWIGLAAIVVALVANAPRIHAADRARQRRGGGVPGGFGVIDELFRPTQHEVRMVQEQRQEAGAESPAPGEPRFRLPERGPSRRIT